MDTQTNDRFVRFGIFPSYFLWIGLALLIFGAGAAYLYFWGGKPEFFTSKVFAVFTSYVKSRYFVVAQTNLLDEIAAVFCLTGLFFMGFSRVNKETVEINDLRLKALLLSVIITVIIWIFIFLFIYGWPIFIVSFFLFYIFLVLFFIIFRINYIRLNWLKKSILKKESL